MNKKKQAHRDVKPANMIVDYDAGILKICDLGSAKKLNKNEKSVSYVSRKQKQRFLYLFELKSFLFIRFVLDITGHRTVSFLRILMFFFVC